MAGKPSLVNLTIPQGTFPLIFSSNALRILERETGKNLDQIVAEIRSGSRAIMHELLWACLEGGRAKTNARPHPWTLSEVGDLLDEHGGSNIVFNTLTHPISIAVIDAWGSAQPEPRPEDKPKGNVEAPAAPDLPADGADVAAP